jgi:hypothetical protein
MQIRIQGLPLFLPRGDQILILILLKTTLYVLINSEATFVRTMGSRRMEVDLAWSVKRSGSGSRISNIFVFRIRKTSKLSSFTLKRICTMYSQHSWDSLNYLSANLATRRTGLPIE